MRKLMKSSVAVLAIILASAMPSFGQCTPAKDADMAKYKAKVDAGENVQSCSQCAMLALYHCSARHCVKDEDIKKVGSLIAACKENINNMGDPICCPELVSKEPEWGADVE